MIAIVLKKNNPKHRALLNRIEELSFPKKVYYNETLRKPILRDGRTHYIGIPAITTYLEKLQQPAEV